MKTECEQNERDLLDPVLQIKAAVRRLVKLAGGIEAAAAEVGVSKSAISNYANPHMADQARVDVIFALEQAIGDPVVVRQLAAMHGYDLVPVTVSEEADADMDAPLPESMDVTYRAAEIGHVLADAVSRGVMTDETAVKLEERCERLVTRAIKLREGVVRVRSWVKKHRKPWPLRKRPSEGV
ncbi:hypothetical protein M2351_006851 [Azospirillum canadense]|nr:hypothetical protein [Azospirillum canadense]